MANWRAWGEDEHNCQLVKCRGCGKYHCSEEKECWTDGRCTPMTTFRTGQVIGEGVTK